jgi:hypothetical protein
MSTKNHISDVLGFEPVKGRYEILGRLYDYIPATSGYSEGMYRADAGHGVSNPCFSLRSYGETARHAEFVGRYLAGRPGVKKPEALEIVARARGKVSKLRGDAYRIADDLRAELAAGRANG